jgi:hypothetical protein
VLWTAATNRPLDEVATLVTLLKEGDSAPGLGDEALRAAAVSRPVSEIRDLVTILNEPSGDGDDADTTLRAAAVGRPIEDVAHLVHLLGSPEDTPPAAAGAAPATRRSALDRIRTARTARGERPSATEPGERSSAGADGGTHAGAGSTGSLAAEERSAGARAGAPRGASANASAPEPAKTPGRVSAIARAQERARVGAAAMRSPLRWPTAAALLLVGVIHLPRDFDGLRSGDYTDGTSCAAAAVCVALAVLLAVHDTWWAWVAGGAAALGVIALHALAAALHTRDVLGHSLGGAVGWGGAATVVCAALVAVLAVTALLYRPPAAQVARSADRA